MSVSSWTRRGLLMFGALLLCACDRTPFCLYIEGRAPQTVYASFPPDRGCFYYGTTLKRADVGDSVCGNFRVANGACLAESGR